MILSHLLLIRPIPALKLFQDRKMAIQCPTSNQMWHFLFLTKPSSKIKKNTPMKLLHILLLHPDLICDSLNLENWSLCVLLATSYDIHCSQ